MVITVSEYVRPTGKSPFGKWFERLNATAAAKVNTALIRLEHGNTSGLKAIGSGVSELRIHAGPGYRVYLGQDGERFVVLLGGGTKKQQDKDIDKAKMNWRLYKKRKKEETTSCP